MSRHLVIVESPAKAKTIEKYLGKEFTVVASYGHVRDLLPKTGAVDPENNFAMQYVPVEKNEKHVATIAKLMKESDSLYLATDPDREGEAISWHIAELLKTKKLLAKKPVHRVAFYEITKAAITTAMKQPRAISMELVNAQQARRALDYLVGFKLSPLLWTKVRRGLSAGRVQSPALRMICEREDEIEAFKSEEYWTIQAQNQIAEQTFSAKLIQYQGEKLSQFSITTDIQAEAVVKTLLDAANGQLLVSKVTKKERKRYPTAPFTTSTLQQEGVRKLGFTAVRTMRVAQQLYEGIDIGGGAVGLISYMRTDSVNLAQDALNDIRDFIGNRYGENNVPAKPATYRTKTKNAQEAHEAIRPTSVARTPESLKKLLSADQYKLYELIWKRTVACQMIHATIDITTVELTAGKNHVFRTNGAVIRDHGFLQVYQEGFDDHKTTDSSDDDSSNTDSKLLPPLTEGMIVSLLKILPEQHFTEPPPRYTEASLVKALEEYGIGRPSTYASIISTLQSREYVINDKKRFQPTDLGRIVNRFLTQYFNRYVDYGFTAGLEDELDAISRGEKEWIPLLQEFWDPFAQQLAHINSTVTRSDVTHEELNEACPDCGKPLSIRLGKRGRFVGCTNYPTCRYTRNLDGPDGETTTPEIIPDRTCPECNSPLQVRTGRYGKFVGCTAYPKCKFIESANKPADTGVECPQCQEGKLVKKFSRYKKIFYACNRYPECKYALWNEPINENCPQCHWPLLTLKTTKRKGTMKVCPKEGCGYEEAVDPKDNGETISEA